MRGALLRTFLLVLAALLSPGPAGADEPRWLQQYNRALWQLWSGVYAEGGETLYCGEAFGRDKGETINAEHVFPMAWVANELGCGDRDRCRRTSPLFNRIERDLHNIYPARADINRARGSRAFAELRGEPREYGGCDVEIRGRRIEPRPRVRGNVARSMFYLSWRYGLEIYPRQGRLLKRWHASDPPDAEERQRNARIAEAQGMRNPFIDHPERAAELPF